MTPQISVPAQPYLLTLTLERTALLVSDMQNDFCTEGGWADRMGLDVRYTQQPIGPLQTLLAGLRQTAVTIIHTREGHRPDLSDCPPHKLERSRRQQAEIGSEGPMGKVFFAVRAPAALGLRLLGQGLKLGLSEATGFQ